LSSPTRRCSGRQKLKRLREAGETLKPKRSIEKVKRGATGDRREGGGELSRPEKKVQVEQPRYYQCVRKRAIRLLTNRSNREGGSFGKNLNEKRVPKGGDRWLATGDRVTETEKDLLFDAAIRPESRKKKKMSQGSMIVGGKWQDFF